MKTHIVEQNSHYVENLGLVCLDLGELCFLCLDAVATSFAFCLSRSKQSVLTIKFYCFEDKLL